MRFGRRDDEDANSDRLDDVDSVGWLKRATLAVVFVVIFAIAGAGWFVYDQGLFQVGDQQIPLIKAEQGATKVRPEDPGGLQIPHQDKLVFERIAPDQSEPLVERLLPPPEIPIERPSIPELPARLTPPPAPSLADVSPPPAPVVETADRSAASEDQADTAAEQLADAQTDADPAEAAPSEQAQQIAAVAPAARPDDAPAPTPNDQLDQVIENLTEELPAPQPEPQQAAVTATPEPDATPSSSSAAEGWRIQVASLRDSTSAEGEWNRLKERHADVLAGLSVNLQRADLDNGTFYRVQAGPLPDRGAAQAACERLKSRSQGCLIVGP